MGSGVSVPASVEEALANGFSQADIDAYLANPKKDEGVSSGDTTTGPPPAASPVAAASESSFVLKSTKYVTVETGELDKADQRFATGKLCQPADFEVLSKLCAYRLKVGQEVAMLCADVLRMCVSFVVGFP